MPECIAAFLQSLWKDALAIKNEGLSQFSKHQFQGKPWSRSESWASQHLPEDLGVLLLGDGFRGGQIVDTIAIRGHHQVICGINLVVHGDPRIVLATTAGWTSSPQQRGHEEFLQGTTHGRGDDACAHPNGSDACFAGGRTGRLPCDAGFGKEIVSSRRVLGQDLITTVTVKPDGRATKEGLGRS